MILIYFVFCFFGGSRIHLIFVIIKRIFPFINRGKDLMKIIKTPKSYLMKSKYSLLSSRIFPLLLSWMDWKERKRLRDISQLFLRFVCASFGNTKQSSFTYWLGRTYFAHSIIVS